jgi:selenocysteine lyase/cysteine desulfurase
MLLDEDFSSLLDWKDEIAAYLKEGLLKRNLLDDNVAHREKHSSIFNIQIDEKAYESLLANNIRCIWRGKGVRIAVHHYNTKEDIDQFFYFLDKIS